MKKLFSIILISLLMLLVTNNVTAAGEHVIVNTSEEAISSEQLRLLENDLIHIEQDYGISVYFVYDESIGASQDALSKYVDDFADKYFRSPNNAGLFINGQYYYIVAEGSAADAIEKKQESLWNAFFDYAVNANTPADENMYKGIMAFYQGCVKIINDEVYNSNVPGVVVATPYVNDYADLFSSSEEQALNKKLLDYKNRYGIDAVIVTTNSTNGMDVADYADDFYDYNGYGDDGILMLLDMSDRTWYFSSKGKGSDYFTDYGIDQIFDDMSDDLSRGRYYDAFVTFVKDIESYTKSAQSGNIIDYHEKKAGFGPGNVVISSIIGFFSSLITGGVMRGKMKNVAPKRFASNYVVGDSFMLTGASDLFVNRTVTRSRRPQRDNDHISSGGGSHYSGGSSIHTSSSGSSHGGHGGHF